MTHVAEHLVAASCDATDVQMEEENEKKKSLS